MVAKMLSQQLAEHAKWLRAERVKQIQLAHLARERADWLEEEACAIETMVESVDPTPTPEAAK